MDKIVLNRHTECLKHLVKRHFFFTPAQSLVPEHGKQLNLKTI